MIEKNIHGVPFLFFENLLGFGNLVHGVSTRNGGVSGAPFASLNLGADTGDAIEQVARNYEIAGNALALNLRALVSSKQVHGEKIAIIDDTSIGRGMFSPKPLLQGYDALITKSPGVTLMVRVADCVPVILFAPERQIAAVVHADGGARLPASPGKLSGKWCSNTAQTPETSERESARQSAPAAIAFRRRWRAPLKRRHSSIRQFSGRRAGSCF